jgi:hypothetical protein
MPWPLYIQGKKFDAYGVEDWVGHRASLDVVTKRNISWSAKNWKLVIQTMAKSD